MEILTGNQMRAVDRYTIDELGIPGRRLMEAAGRGIAERLLADHGNLLRRRGLLILCGKGNNGGDGLVVARVLLASGVTAEVLLLAEFDALRGDAAWSLEAARAASVDVVSVPDSAAWSAERGRLDRGPLVLDAMLGTGIEGGARGLIAEVIDDLAERDLRVVAVDVPSGVNADRAELEGTAVRADHTYTLCRPKLALTLRPAAGRAGGWTVVPIGIPDEAVRRVAPETSWLDDELARGLMPVRPVESHKGTFGHLLVVAGSRGKSGAAVLVARGALRSGVGLVSVATPHSVRSEVATQQAEIMTEGIAEDVDAGVMSAEAVAEVTALAERRDALAIGPGLGTEPTTRKAVRTLIQRRECPAVVDADALNAIARDGLDSGRLRAAEHGLVLTPHPGEAGRLLGSATAEVQADRLGSARRLARESGAVVVLKGHRSLIAEPDGHVTINSSGNPGMATGGSGDVLTGIIGAFLARGIAALDAARLGVYVHGLAGDLAAADQGVNGMIAGDLVARLPHVLRMLTEGPTQ